MKILSIIFFLFISFYSCSQNTITGNFTDLANKQVKLIGYEGFDTYIIDSAQANENGVFKLSFNKSDYGIGYIKVKDGKTLIVVLAKDENLKIKGKNFTDFGKIKIIEGKENKLFGHYAMQHPRREKTLSCWNYLEKIYSKDSLFSVHKAPKQAIEKEKQRIKAEDSLFLANLAPNSYVSWYLPLRKLISSVSVIAQYRTEQIPSVINTFRNLDYTDNRLYKSGILGKTLDAYFWLIENSGRSLDSVYIEMDKSIDCIIENISENEQKLNEITEYLFKLLEKRSLFKSSEYLALKLLNENSCTLNSDFVSQLENYRAMKKGNIAPDIKFTGDLYTPGYKASNSPKKLSDLNNKYTVVIFGASWCPACPKKLSEVSYLYKKWKNHGVEVVFISLDTDKSNFENFTSVFPFISTCDYKKWEGKAVKDYHVFASPTIYLLDDKRKIILSPSSVRQLDAWVNWYLVKKHR